MYMPMFRVSRQIYKSVAGYCVIHFDAQNPFLKLIMVQSTVETEGVDVLTQVGPDVSISTAALATHIHCAANNSGDVAKARDMDVPIHVLFIVFTFPQMVSSERVVRVITGGLVVCPLSCIHFFMCVQRWWDAQPILKTKHQSHVSVSQRKMLWIFFI